MSPPLHQQRPLEDKKIPSPNGGSPPAHLQNMKPRPESSPSLAVLSNHHHGVGGLTQAPPHGGGYPVYQNSGGHQPPLQVNMSQCEYKQMPSVPIIFICTQLAPMVSPRHFASAPAPPAMEQFGHCPKVRFWETSPQATFSGKRGSGPFLQLLLEHNRRERKDPAQENQISLSRVPDQPLHRWGHGQPF